MDINNILDFEYSILDLGFNKLLNKQSISSESDLITPEMLNYITAGISSKSIISGELLGNTDVKEGYLQSYNFVSGSTGWRLDSDGSLEANSGVFRGKLKVGGLIINVSTTESIQDAIDEAYAAGGGTIILQNGIHTPSQNINLYSNIYLQGQNKLSTLINGKKIIVTGTDVYSTGTISVSAGGTTVTGSGTSWTSGMAGRSILLSGIWYNIALVTDSTHLIINYAYADTNLSGSSYIIALNAQDVKVSNLTMLNVAGSSLDVDYVNECVIDFMTFVNCTTGIDVDNSSNIEFNNIDTAYCTTAIDLNATHYSLMTSCGLIDSLSKGISITGCTNLKIDGDFILGSAGNGIELTNSSVILFLGCTSKNNGDNGIELISGNNNIQIISSNLSNNTNDGISLTATSDNCQISNNQLVNNGAWGINIANANCDNNVLSSNYYFGNSSGEVNNSGTSTKIIDGTDANLITSDITTNNVSTSKHGFVPKAPNDATKFLRGDATWAVPSSSAPVFGAGQTSRAVASGTGTQNVAHGLSKAPSLIKVTAFLVYNDNVDSEGAMSVGSSLGASGETATSYYNNSGNQGGTQKSGAIIYIRDESDGGGTDKVIADVSAVDATNFTLNFTTMAALSTNANTLLIQWEAFA